MAPPTAGNIMGNKPQIPWDEAVKLGLISLLGQQSMNNAVDNSDKHTFRTHIH